MYIRDWLSVSDDDGRVALFFKKGEWADIAYNIFTTPQKIKVVKQLKEVIFCLLLDYYLSMTNIKTKLIFSVNSHSLFERESLECANKLLPANIVIKGVLLQLKY